MRGGRLALATLVAVAALAPAPTAAARKARASCQLKVVNKTPFRVLVHINGVYWGWVNAQQAFAFKGIPAGPIVAYGTTQYAEHFWGPQPLKCSGEANWDLRF